MTLSHGFRRLANVLDHLEANGFEVLDAATADDDPSDGLTVDLTVTVPTDANESTMKTPLAGENAENDSEVGTSKSDESGKSTAGARERVLDPLSVRADATNGATAVEAPDDAVTSVEDGAPDGGTESGAEVGEDAEADTQAEEDAVDCPVGDCDATFESDHGMKIHRTKVHGTENDGVDGGAPAYRDPDRLRDVYATCDSFTEMRAALDTDVSTQTVRRQMIAHGIYEPGESSSDSTPDEGETGDGVEDSDSSSTPADSSPGPDDEDDAENNGDGDDDDGELTAIELPEGVTVADLKSGVASAQTLYDVQQRFDLDRTEAMQLLEKYDLLELVHGRVSNRDRRKQVDEDEITRRILEHAPGTQPSQA